MAAARYWAAFAFLALIPLGGALGGAWTFLLIAVLPIALIAFDEWLGDEQAARPTPGPYRLLPYLYIPAQIAVMAWVAWLAARNTTPLLDLVGLTLSTGVAAGVFGFIAAHEMVHSSAPRERLLGLAMLAAMLDMPFAISHVQGHHRRAATFEDPASARRGESLYAFIPRSLAGQVREAWQFETRRLERAGRPVFDFDNRMVVYATVEAALIAMAAAWSWRALAFLVADAVIAVVLLEAFNYIAHYGLTRRRRANGRLEPLHPRHSWNSRRRANNATLFNMGRHADHHRFSARPYEQLEPMRGAAMLPAGYASVLLLAFIPPLFMRLMDPRVDAVMGAPEVESLAIAAE
jgi:alkane 1-monooxygenase